MATKRITRPVIVSVENPMAQQAAVQLIPVSAQSLAYIYTRDNTSNNTWIVQTNKSRLQFFWSGFEDISGIEHYEYRVIPKNSQSD